MTRLMKCKKCERLLLQTEVFNHFKLSHGYDFRDLDTINDVMQNVSDNITMLIGDSDGKYMGKLRSFHAGNIR